MEINRTAIIEKVSSFLKTMLAEEMPKQHIKENYDLSRTGITSIQFIQFIILIESEFSIEIPDEYLIMSEMNTLNKIADVVINCMLKNEH